ncbi:MAG: right-handed parallel beta-helix repeat-containing protein [Lentisphaerae bacterium]|jgi:hypothetical protein|nr:right-handed parallel beta-helix repeat-containing protein [Lentisphaerota bacterium]MBT4819977.1 right-handed parallel beta-helix repeat-containing protein [Lentisphaerota bacterium]MBT5607943.1 right-handed parallel beta-helix repeat-containing protein [Lentisphaerota bacterium]MBT7056537.1 right-handed parallel beta-helix repeat-containing protein [Lentisphaerota bacterium]MBT7846328.1 right-handed parallel beta-helix repeat-containing protein [Lentisphaerota bacterium]
MPQPRTHRVTLPELVTLTAALLLPMASLAAERFVSPTGDDAAVGTRDAPWQTLAKVNASAAAGDTIAFLPGAYPGTFEPGNDGTPEAPIIFRSAEKQAAKLLGGNPAIILAKRRHITIDGLAVTPTNGRFLQATECETIRITNCRFEGSRGSYVSSMFDRCRDIRISDCEFDRHLSVRRGAVLVGNMIQANHCDGFVLERNTIGRAGHSPAHLRECKRMILRKNVFCAKWGRGFETFNAEPMLFEENVITEEVDSGGSADSRGKIMAIGGIVRRNLVLHNYDMALASNSYIYRKEFPAWVLKNTRIYHNTFYHNHTYAWIITAMSSDLTTVSGNVWQNNIFFDNDPLGDGRQLQLGYLGEGNRFVNNTISGSAPGQKVIALLEPGSGYKRYSLNDAEKRFPNLFSSNQDTSVRFIDIGADDLRLAPTSPGIDTGKPLGKTRSEGNGNELPVDDTRPFYDGFGLPGEIGDTIWVGESRQQARVVKADHQRNLLVVDRTLRWKAGAAVSLPYAGAAPDMGALERGGENQSWYRPVTVPPGLRWQPPTGPGAQLVACDFRNETLETWGFIWNLDRKRNTDYELVRGAGPEGGNALRLFAAKDKAILAGDIKPRVWRIDRFPRIRFTYRIASGVPVGLWLDGFDTEATGGTRVCVGGTEQRNTGGVKDLETCELRDDDQWHESEIDARVIRQAFPKLTHLQAFQFYTRNNAKKGQSLLIGSFSISAEE